MTPGPEPVDPLRAEEVLDQVLAAPVSERENVMTSLCSGDEPLRREVMSLLTHLPDPETESSDVSEPAEPAMEGRSIGGCRIERLLGRGGGGRVFSAWQEWPPRRVAVKVLRPELLSESARRRFRRETRALARLDHPGISRILAAGMHGEPGAELPYVVMELVEPGVTITDWWARTSRPLEARLDRFAGMCDTIHHGHTRGLVHRDLKPSNVLVNAADDLKVIDFGVASITADDGSAATVTGAVTGTPGYMAPEQFDAAAETDLRTDVHALGVLLYECLAGRPAFARPGLHLAAAARAISMESPPPLSSIRPRIDRDLITIVEHAMAKDPADRYQSASEMAADLRRHLGERPILARPTSGWRRLRLFARRNPLATLAWSVAVIALVAAVSATVVFGLRESEAAGRAARSLAAAEASLKRSWIAELTRAIEVEDSTGVRQTRERLAGDESWPVRLLDALADESEGSVLQSDYPSMRGFSAMACDVSPDGHMLAFCGDSDFGVALVDVDSMRIVRFLAPGTGAWAIAFDPVRGRLLMADEKHLMTWDPPWEGTPRVHALPFPAGTGIAASPEGDRVAVAGDGQAAVLEIETGRVLATSERGRGQTTRIDWSPDGKWIAMGVEPESVQVLHADSLREAFRHRAPRQRSQALAFDPGGRLLAWGGDMRVLHVAPIDGSGPVRKLPMDFSIWGIDWHPSEPVIAVADRGKGVRLVEVPTDGGELRLIGSYRGNNAEVWDVDWAPDGSRLFSAGQVEVHAWDPRPRQGPHRTELGSPGLSLVFTAEGLGAVQTGDGSLWSIPADPHKPARRRWQVQDFSATCAAGDPVHDRWAWISDEGVLAVVSPSDGPPWRLSLGGFAEPPARATFSPDGEKLAVIGRSAEDPLVIVGVVSGRVEATIPGPWPSVISGMTWIDDRKVLVSTFGGGSVLREREPGRWENAGPLGGSWIAPTVTGDGGILFGTMGGDAIEFDLTSAKIRRIFRGVTDIPLCLSVSPDGRLVAASGNDRRLHVFERESQDQVLSLSGHGPGRRVIGVAFSPDGERVLSLDTGGTLLHWVPRPPTRGASR